jgi:hypothetical protein
VSALQIESVPAPIEAPKEREHFRMNQKRNQNSLRNLKPPWRAGQTGNPSGINRKRPYTDEYLSMSQSPAPAELIAKLNRQFKTPFLSENATWAQVHVTSLFLQVVLKGDVTALREIADRIEGRPPQRLDPVSMERQEISFRVVEEDPQVRQGRENEYLTRHLDMLVERSNDEEIKQAASALALLMRQRVNAKIDGEST